MKTSIGQTVKDVGITWLWSFRTDATVLLAEKALNRLIRLFSTNINDVTLEKCYKKIKRQSDQESLFGETVLHNFGRFFSLKCLRTSDLSLSILANPVNP